MSAPGAHSSKYGISKGQKSILDFNVNLLNYNEYTNQ